MFQALDAEGSLGYHSIDMVIWVLSMLFARSFGICADEKATSIAFTPDGGAVVVGRTTRSEEKTKESIKDIIIIKVSQNGALEWAKTFDVSDAESMGFVVVTPNGEILVAVDEMTYTIDVVWILRLSPQGEVKNASMLMFSTPSDHGFYYHLGRVRSMVITPQGEVLLGGWVLEFGETDFLVMKLDLKGNLKWYKVVSLVGYGNAEIGYSAVQAEDGNIWLAGQIDGIGAGSKDAAVVRIPKSGSVRRIVVLGGPYDETAYSVVATRNSNVIVAGYTRSFGYAGDFLVAKLDADGNLLWAKAIGGTGWDVATSVAETPEGNILVAGKTTSFGNGLTDLMLVELNPNGDLIWAKTFGRKHGDEASSFVITPEGNILIAGTGATDAEAMAHDTWVFKVPPSGEYPACFEECAPTVRDITSEINVIVERYEYVQYIGIGQCSTSASYHDITQGIDVQDLCEPYGDNPATQIASAITCSPLKGALLFKTPERITLQIYSPDGRLVRSLELAPGENRVELAPGVYVWTAGGTLGKGVVR